MKIMLVEDEAPAMKRLERMVLEAQPDATFIARADSVEDAVLFLSTNPSLDLIFMDIQLADGLSFDIFSKTTVSAPVIFTTAFDHYAVQAFKVNSIDYLLKPIEPEGLKAAFEKYHALYAQKQMTHPDYAAIVQALKVGQPNFKKRFLVKSGGRLGFVPTGEVSYFLSEEGMSFVVTNTNQRYILESTLEDLEGQLDPEAFFRINRKMIVALSAIVKMEPHFNHRVLLELNPPFQEEVIVSRQRSAEFKMWLDQ
jgi:DNA-binding LytR/AlgR family response regulator